MGAAELFATVLSRALPPGVVPFTRLFAAGLCLAGAPTGPATAVALLLAARRGGGRGGPPAGWHLAATVTAALLAWPLGGLAASHFFDMIQAVQ